MNSDLIEFRWRQKEDYDGNDLGPPVLQWRQKFSDAGDGRIAVHWDWSLWEDVPTVREVKEI